MLKKKLKKGQIGLTITWIPAVLVTFFIMAIFMLTTIGLTGMKISPAFLGGEGGFNEITFDNIESNELSNQRKLIMLFNTPIEDKILSERIIQWQLGKIDKKDLEKDIKGILEKNEGCYLFEIKGIGDININSPDISRVDVGSALGITSKENKYLELYEKSSIINLFASNQKINIRFNTGKCI
ncbi:hypothetical protein CMI40_01385 [Candidatus Pacearchaeota archaeon]|jgi:hypothetical protein|nr:hypothetical protein [Candidatus Pacearchaeota archaeon]|tara:strand:+ start:1162 stop:1710 length:549 start_codon:yes stop_codon:yes gene_type:complete